MLIFSLGFPANRALLSFMFGACFLLIGLIDLLPVRIKYFVAILFVALSAGRQFLWSVEYLRDWQALKNMFWQLAWRAPGIKPGTLLLMNEELLFNADNSISAPLNWIYKTDQTSDMDYFIFYPTNRLNASLPALQKDIPIRYAYLAGEFTGNTSDTLAFYFNPPACLRLLEPDLDSKNRFIPTDSLMREASALSNTDRILAEPSFVIGPTSTDLNPIMAGVITSKKQTSRGRWGIGRRLWVWEMEHSSATGAERWRVDFVERFKAMVPEFGFISSPLVDRGGVYVQAANSVVKLDARTGAVVWRTLEGGATVFESGAFSSPIVATLAGVRQLVVQTRETLNGVELETAGCCGRSRCRRSAA